ncbi:hypothetical protein BOTBODRAFT_187105 [Botryobasidium botryosum FD-172 SS1]|uniref:Uncharacterized protein n=1 Tax=Botryobasidium botryosum (strain FD-172 SS1) TaxID=930990 RepID=A0A067MVR0_BOTB1|nr:hypothetical protein BOTBODRAFT_187105 [Botryobasidium botryosum FD-172 SS1]
MHLTSGSPFLVAAMAFQPLTPASPAASSDKTPIFGSSPCLGFSSSPNLGWMASTAARSVSFRGPTPRKVHDVTKVESTGEASQPLSPAFGSVFGKSSGLIGLGIYNANDNQSSTNPIDDSPLSSPRAKPQEDTADPPTKLDSVLDYILDEYTTVDHCQADELVDDTIPTDFTTTVDLAWQSEPYKPFARPSRVNPFGAVGQGRLSDSENQVYNPPDSYFPPYPSGAASSRPIRSLEDMGLYVVSSSGPTFEVFDGVPVSKSDPPTSTYTSAEPVEAEPLVPARAAAADASLDSKSLPSIPAASLAPKEEPARMSMWTRVALPVTPRVYTPYPADVDALEVVGPFLGWNY